MQHEWKVRVRKEQYLKSSGEPLFSKFCFEDWALLSIRYELHLVMHAFNIDGGAGHVIPQDRLQFYYRDYLEKELTEAHRRDQIVWTQAICLHS